MSATIRNEQAGSMLGVEGRFFPVIAWPNGKLANQQFKATRYYEESGRRYRITAEVRFDDNCKNGHETFAITADIREAEGGYWREYAGGCCHEEIAKQFPELAPLIKWHLVSVDGPMHYLANTLYHADEHGPDSAWIYYTGADPLGFSKGERLLCYARRGKAEKVEGKPGYRVNWDQKTAKTASLDHARSSAVWPDATLEQLRDKVQLAARLPALLADFKADMIAAGFIWPK